MTLTKQLQDQQDGFRQNAAQDIQNAMDEATNRLAASGITDAAPKQRSKLLNFDLANQTGEKRSLTNLIKNGPVVVTFYRGGWCPYCNLELRAWQQALPEITALGATLVAITPELPDESLTTSEKNALEFETLTDLDSAYAREIGLVFSLPDELRPIYADFGIDIEKHNGKGQFDLPLAATFVVDRNQTIVNAYVNADYTKRQEPSEVLDTLKNLAENAQTV